MVDAMVDLEAALARLRVLENEAGNRQGSEPASSRLLYEVLRDVIVSVTDLRDQMSALEVRVSNLEPTNPR